MPSLQTVAVTRIPLSGHKNVLDKAERDLGNSPFGIGRVADTGKLTNDEKCCYENTHLY
jgi:hypothetical protein